MSNSDDTNFLSRWSQRKAAVKRGAVVEDTASTKSAVTEGAPVGATEAGTGNPSKSPELTEADFKDVDFSALTYQSDYSRFLAKGVPESIRQKALGRLWASDPMFTAVDQFQDYAGDFTDQALAVPAGMLKSAYKVGQGFLSDEEAQVWDDLGKPEKPSSAQDAMPASVAAASAARSLISGYTVRPATTDDVHDLASVAGLALGGAFTQLHGPAFARGMAQRATHEALAEGLAQGLKLDVAVHADDGKIIGFCGGVDRDITWHVVWPEHGRKGVGTALLRHVEARLGPGDLNPNVLASRVSAGLLKRLGYDAIAEQVVDTPGGVSATLVVMRRA